MSHDERRGFRNTITKDVRIFIIKKITMIKIIKHSDEHKDEAQRFQFSIFCSR